MKHFTRSSNSVRIFAALIAAVLFSLLLTQAATLYAFPVPELPTDNLLVNPWFRDANDPSRGGLDGWTSLTTGSAEWGLSQKESNPTPDIVISGRCGNDPVYCGTAARWAEQFGVTYPNVDVYLSQLVAADAEQLKLRFFTHWVSHRVEVAEVTIYGSQSPDGPWTPVWVPLFHSQDKVEVPDTGDQQDLWTDTGFLETTLAEGYSHYKVEIHTRYPDGEGVGFKITGVYFAVGATSGDGFPSPTGTVEATPTATGTAIVDDPVEIGDDLQLSATALSSSQIELTWIDSLPNERGYAVERSLDGVSGWSRIARLPSDATGFVNGGLIPGATYFYRLNTSAIDGSRMSNVVWAMTE